MDAEAVGRNIAAREKADEMFALVLSETVDMTDEGAVRYYRHIRDAINSILPEEYRLVKNAPMVMEDGARNQSDKSGHAVWASISERCVHESDLAYKFVMDGRDVWIPKSEIMGDHPVVGDTCGELKIPEWLAASKGLDYDFV